MITYNTQAPDVAAQYLHTCVVHRGNGNPAEICSFGIEPRRLLMLLKDTGYAVSLSDATPFPPMSCPEVGTYTTLQGFSEIPVAAARARLTREPIVTDMYVWDDFFDYTTNRAPSYSPNMLWANQGSTPCVWSAIRPMLGQSRIASAQAGAMVRVSAV